MLKIHKDYGCIVTDHNNRKCVYFDKILKC